jgi:hypothetical protein
MYLKKSVKIFKGTKKMQMKKKLKSKNSKKNRQKPTRKKAGRGNFVSFLSKNTLNRILSIIKNMIQETVSAEINKAGFYSVQLDTTQDISAIDVCSVILRSVDDSVSERLLSAIPMTASTGDDFLKMLKKVLKKNNIEIKNCIGNSTDGAGNMSGIYKGFSALLSKINPLQVHIWCYAHVLNLVLGDATASKTSIQASNLFSLLNMAANFIKDSYQRMNVWKGINKKDRRRISSIGDTRWSAKEVALKKIFGTIDSSENCLFVKVITFFEKITENCKLDGDARLKAKTILDSFLKYETIMIAFIYLRIFEHTSPLSQYLQSQDANLLAAERMIRSTISEINTFSRDFKTVKAKADEFVLGANEHLKECESDCKIDEKFTEKRVGKKKVMPGEKAVDEPIQVAEKNFEVNVHNVIMDVTLNSLKTRFEQNQNLLRDLAIFDPKNFTTFANIPDKALNDLTNILRQFFPNLTRAKLASELMDFKRKWKTLSETIEETYIVDNEDEEDKEEETDEDDETESEEEEKDEDENEDEGKDRFEEENEEEVSHNEVTSSEDEEGKLENQFILENGNVCKKRCRNCVRCCYALLKNYSLYADAYKHIFMVYKYILTLSITQVSCERSFSKLKIIKNRLRSTLTTENFEALFLMSVENQILQTLDNDLIIDRLALTSKTFSKLLLLL